jgi:dTDP-4-dehydrorhamnose reductase
MRITVTGGSGLLGSNLAFELCRRGHEVTAVCRQHTICIDGVCTAQCDLADVSSTSRLLELCDPAWIIHCAAATDLDWCETHSSESMRINAEVPRQLAATARSIGARLIYISTDAVFSGAVGGYCETDPVCPVNQYGRSKAAGETAVLCEMPAALILRVNIYGWNARRKNSLAEWALALLRNGEPVSGFRDVTFSPILVNDLAECILEFLQAGSSGIYHVGSCDYATKYEFLRELARIFDLDDALVRESSVEESKLTTPRPRNTWLRTDKVAHALGRCMPSVREGLENLRALSESGFLSRLKAAAAA